MDDYCVQHNICGLGDGGYHSRRVKSPLRMPRTCDDLSYNEKQRSLRAIVETLQGLVQFWAAAGARFTLPNLALHAQAVMCCYHLEQFKLLNDNPFHPPTAV
eukprot:TRINITY_DN3770_c0_g1_i3.p1 TRINITY_DN3770_c0_g1~~TRINITY_DN3770_c0_g1_i3.p1  ORF type:complete len:102 (-),score=19.03 TRINITY_DN3770_c0_g1_i3:112-417(-)